MDNYFTTERVENLFIHLNAMKKIILKDNCKNNVCDLKSIGLKIQSARKKLGLNQGEFADKINFHVTSLSRLESGKLNTTLDTICAIATITGKPMSYFFGEEPKVSYNSDVEILKKQIFEIKEEMKKYKK